MKGVWKHGLLNGTGQYKDSVELKYSRVHFKDSDYSYRLYSQRTWKDLMFGIYVFFSFLLATVLFIARIYSMSLFFTSFLADVNKDCDAPGTGGLLCRFVEWLLTFQEPTENDAQTLLRLGRAMDWISTILILLYWAVSFLCFSHYGAKQFHSVDQICKFMESEGIQGMP